MAQIVNILGENFLDKIFMMPTVLGMLFIVRYIIQYYCLNKSDWIAFSLYAINFTFFIIVLKLLFNNINSYLEYGYIINDISLVFSAITVVYLALPHYKYIEYEVIPQFILYYILYLHMYGFELKSSILVLTGLAMFWCVIYVLCNYKKMIAKYYVSYLLISMVITASEMLIGNSQFRLPTIFSVQIFFKVFLLLIIVKVVIHFITIVSLLYTGMKREIDEDALTAAYNRKKFQEVLNEIVNSNKIPFFSIVLFDIDSFKAINDKYGHLAGDYVLREVSLDVKTILLQEKHNGQLFRYGGEEFFIIFRNQHGDAVTNIMEHITHYIANKDYIYDGRLLNVSISVGVSEIVDKQSVQIIIDHVDRNMYVAKNRGKNQVFYN